MCLCSIFQYKIVYNYIILIHYIYSLKIAYLNQQYILFCLLLNKTTNNKATHSEEHAYSIIFFNTIEYSVYLFPNPRQRFALRIWPGTIQVSRSR